MNSLSVEAIVLKRRNFGEADRVLSLFTDRLGKVSILAKGVRKINSRRGGSIEQLNYIKVYLREKNDRYYLNEVEILKSFPRLKKNLERISQTYITLELVDQFLEEQEINKNVFQLLLTTLEKLEETKNLEKAKVYLSNFQMKFLNEIGYLPELYRCAKCRKMLNGEAIFLSPSSGGLVDRICKNQSLVCQEVSLNATKTLRFLEKEPFELISRLSLQKPLLNEVYNLLNFYTAFHLERDLRAPNFVADVEKLVLADK